MNITAGMLFTKEHEWIKVDGDTATMGSTGYATHQLGDIVFVEMPETGDMLTQFEPFGVVESVKTVSDMYAPISGEVMERNHALLQEIDGTDNQNFHPEYLNEEPYGKGWIIKIRISNKNELNNLLNPEQYTEITK